MNKKMIIIIAGSVIVAAGIVFGVVYFINQAQHPSTDDKSSSTTVLDHSKDYGACTTLDTSAIKAALGEYAANLQAPENMGIVGDRLAGDGVDGITSDSQLCVYAFASGGKLENGFNSENAFIVQKTVYTNESGPKALIEQTKLDTLNTSVDGLGDAAFYSANTVATGPNATYSFKLQVFSGNASTEYTIHQPAETASFTAETGQAVLVQLAKQAK